MLSFTRISPVPALVGLLWTGITGLAKLAKPFGDKLCAFTGMAPKSFPEDGPPCGSFVYQVNDFEFWDHEPLGTFASQFLIGELCW